MKKYILLLAFSFSFGFTLAQPIWNTLLPWGTSDLFIGIPSMLKTTDGNYTILSQRYGNEYDGEITTYYTQYMLKYNINGELLWEKNDDFGYDLPFGIGGVFPRAMVEMSNQHIVTIGEIDNFGKAYLFVGNSAGDSLFFKAYPEYSAFYKMSVFDNDEVICTGWHNATNQPVLLKININSGNITEQHFFPFSNTSNIFLVDNKNYYLRYTTFSDSISLSKYSLDGSLILNVKEKLVSGFGDWLQDFDQNLDGSYVIYSKGLIVFNEDLEITLELPFNENSLNVSPLEHDVSHILSTSDGGYLASGFLTGTSNQNVYMIKVNNFGLEEWGRAYSQFLLPINYISHVIEESDGYVFIGIHLASSENWLIKMKKDGTLTNINKLALQTKNIQLFPNPCYDFITISIPTTIQQGQVRIFNTQGQLVFNTPLLDTMQVLPVADLKAGVYFLQLFDENNMLYSSSKFLKM